MGFPDFSFEKRLIDDGYMPVGIDEVGRGAFAGPVGVGGVVFDPKLTKKDKEYLLSLGINDSKKLSPKKREYLAEIIKEKCLSYNISFINVETINKIGIGKATYMGMQQVANNLKFKISNLKLKTQELFVLVDGFEIPALKIAQKGLVRGDSLSISIAAASIIAKVERDLLMDKLGADFPEYGFQAHKGYGTVKHRQAITSFGVSNNHRTDFCKKTVNSL